MSGDVGLVVAAVWMLVVGAWIALSGRFAIAAAMLLAGAVAVAAGVAVAAYDVRHRARTRGRRRPTS